MERVQALIPTLAPIDPPVSVVPNVDGAIVLERTHGQVELSVAIEPNGEMFLCADHVDTEELRELQTGYDEQVIDVFLRTGRFS